MGKTYTLAGSLGRATCERLAPAAYRVEGIIRGVDFRVLYTGVGAQVDAFIAAKRAAFEGLLPRKALVRTGETAVGLQPVQIRRVS